MDWITLSPYARPLPLLLVELGSASLRFIPPHNVLSKMRFLISKLGQLIDSSLDIKHIGWKNNKEKSGVDFIHLHRLAIIARSVDGINS